MNKKWIVRIVVILMVVAVVVFGIFKLTGKKNTINSQLDNVSENLNGYYMEANMEFHNGDDIRYYLVKVSYQKADDAKENFRVSMLDKGINQEQIIIRNADGVYVLTPALNQVYKFKGDWPLNGAKPYLYQSMLDVFKGDYEKTKLDDGYLITSKPNYKNAPNWVRQEMKLTKDLKPVWLHIYDVNDNVAVKVSFLKVEFDPNFQEKYFDVTENMSQARSELTTTTTSTLQDLPLYPTNAIVSASLKEQSVITVNGQTQHILTYEGEEPFTVIQYILENNAEMVVYEIDGEIVEVSGTVGYVRNNQLVYEYNGVCYHLYSDTLSVSKLIEVANGMEVVTIK